MDFVQATAKLSDAGVLTMLTAAIEAARTSGQPQCIVIVDASGVVLGAFRMSGARYLSLKSATAKARTSSSIGTPSDSVPEAARSAIAAATEGNVTGLRGGLPIRLGGMLLGGIGVGSGSGDQDVAVARSALEAIGADLA